MKMDLSSMQFNCESCLNCLLWPSLCNRLLHVTDPSKSFAESDVSFMQLRVSGFPSCPQWSCNDQTHLLNFWGWFLIATCWNAVNYACDWTIKIMTCSMLIPHAGLHNDQTCLDFWWWKWLQFGTCCFTDQEDIPSTCTFMCVQVGW